jgi:signal transduction histidine kinase
VLDLGLSAAVEWQVNQFQRRTGIACEVIATPERDRMTTICATAFFRILQESLTNHRAARDSNRQGPREGRRAARRRLVAGTRQCH